MSRGFVPGSRLYMVAAFAQELPYLASMLPGGYYEPYAMVITGKSQEHLL
jgi:hypothetical protein